MNNFHGGALWQNAESRGGGNKSNVLEALFQDVLNKPTQCSGYFRKKSELGRALSNAMHFDCGIQGRSL